MTHRDVTRGIERVESHEERCGVRLGGLSAFVEASFDTISVTLRGEIAAREGDELARDLELTAAIYDSAGRVVGTANQPFFSDTFFGADTFELVAYVPVNDVARVRVVPKLV